MRNWFEMQSGASNGSLLVVLVAAIIVVFIGAWAIPSFLPSMTSRSLEVKSVQAKANEASVVSALRVISRAESTYSLTNGRGYGTFDELGAASLLDSTWTGTPVRNGYRFTLVTGSSGRGFCVTAEVIFGSSGENSYAISNRGVIYQLPGDDAPSCDPNSGFISTGTVLATP